MMTAQSIRCGNRRGGETHYHDSIAEVQACFQGRYAAAAAPVAAPEPPAPAPQQVEPRPYPRNFRSSGPSIWELAKSIPEGRYALAAAEDRTNFYEVSYGDAGTKWSGFVFINKLASDNRLEMRPAERAKAFEGILKDIEAASLLYGQKSGRCGVCGRTLTDDKPGGSIERGIGPDCAKKTGWG